MKMKMILTMLAVVAMGFSTWAGDGNVKVDTEASSVTWNATKVGGAHEGTINISSGALEFKGHALVGGEFTIDMTSIACTDLESEKMNGKLVGHLNSPDFFNTAEFPTASFKITGVEAKEDAHEVSVTGDLTIKGTTKALTFDASLGHDGGSNSASAHLVIDRSEFDVRYGSKSFFDNLGDRYIHDLFTLKVKLVSAAE